MATYYVNASGTNESPYDTPAKGAINFDNLSSVGDLSGDIVEVVYGTIDDSTSSSTPSWGASVIRSYGTDGSDRTSNKPVINAGGLSAFGVGGFSASKIYNLIIMDKIVRAGEIYGCVVKATTPISDYGIDMEQHSGAIALNNVILNYRAALITGYACGSFTDMTICNNTAYIPSFESSASAFTFQAMTGNCTILNNIVYSDTSTTNFKGFYSTGGDTLPLDYCLAYGCDVPFSGQFSLGDHTSIEDPAFQDVANFDVRLTSSSPAWNGGTPDGSYSGIVPGTDISGVSRPVGSAYDMGAYEMQFTANSFSSGTANPGETVTSTLDAGYVASLVQSEGTDTYFDTAEEVGSAMVQYTHQDGRQRKRIFYAGPNLSGQTSWPSGARDGTWEKDLVTLWDYNGAKASITRSTIGSSEDIIITDGTATLNT